MQSCCNEAEKILHLIRTSFHCALLYKLDWSLTAIGFTSRCWCRTTQQWLGGWCKWTALHCQCKAMLNNECSCKTCTLHCKAEGGSWPLHCKRCARGWFIAKRVQEVVHCKWVLPRRSNFPRLDAAFSAETNSSSSPVPAHNWGTILSPHLPSDKVQTSSIGNWLNKFCKSTSFFQTCDNAPWAHYFEIWP